MRSDDDAGQRGSATFTRAGSDANRTLVRTRDGVRLLREVTRRPPVSVVGAADAVWTASNPATMARPDAMPSRRARHRPYGMTSGYQRPHRAGDHGRDVASRVLGLQAVSDGLSPEARRRRGATLPTTAGARA